MRGTLAGLMCKWQAGLLRRLERQLSKGFVDIIIVPSFPSAPQYVQGLKGLGPFFMNGFRRMRSYECVQPSNTYLRTDWGQCLTWTKESVAMLCHHKAQLHRGLYAGPLTVAANEDSVCRHFTLCQALGPHVWPVLVAHLTYSSSFASVNCWFYSKSHLCFSCFLVIVL